MPTIDSNIATTRQNSDAADLKKPLPPDQPNGAFAMGSYTVTAADDTAGESTITTGLNEISSYIIQVYTAAGVYVPLTDLDVSVDGGDLVLADGAATDDVTATWSVQYIVRGK